MPWKWWPAFGLVAGTVALADDTAIGLHDISGALRADYFRSSRCLDNGKNYYGITAQTTLRPVFGERVDGKIDARVTNAAVTECGTTDAMLREAYVTARFDSGALRIGRQIVAWGRADSVNPTDNLTPRDFTVPLPFDDDKRVGAVAVTYDHYIDVERTLSVFATPFFEPSRLPPSDDAAMIELRPARTPSNTEIAIKLNRTGSQLDWSISYFRGFSLLPALRPSADAGIFTLYYPRIEVLGADMARNFAPYAIRAEVAYVVPMDREAPSDIRRYLFAVAGVDRTFFGTFNVNMQWIQRRPQGDREPDTAMDTASRTAALQNALLFGQQNRTNDGLTMRISNRWLSDTLLAELFVFSERAGHSTYLRPLLTYDIDDHVKLAVGADVYRGADDTYFGQLKRNRGAFVELRYAF